MVQAFSLTSDSLSYFLGYTLVHADRVAIVSPWMSDVQLQFPVNDVVSGRRLRFVEALSELSNSEIYCIVREGESHNAFIRNRLPDHVTFLEVSDLHAKAIVCDEFVYLGSANITRGGFSLNRELCEVIENEYGDTLEYLSNELALEI